MSLLYQNSHTNILNGKKIEKSLQMGHTSRFEMNYQDFFEDNENSHSLFKQDEELLELNKEVFLENQIISNLI